jgi:hypothetical protein
METFVLIYITQTHDAVLVFDTDPDDGIWLPKSQIEYHEQELAVARAGDDIEFNIPEWLAEEKGLI